MIVLAMSLNVLAMLLNVLAIALTLTGAGLVVYSLVSAIIRRSK